ncbi:MAG: hypothetical protein JO266_17585 [Acidobacteria bacterium]|nr:hypothetical protein [Acidobacteriota bacterium]
MNLIGSWEQETPFFGVDVNSLEPGRPATIDAKAIGYPVRSLEKIAPGDYHVQALVNVYTYFHRADGHAIWVHMDQWEGQQFNSSPGNLYSAVQRVRISARNSIRLEASRVIPPVKIPPDTLWVKHIRFESRLLTTFWVRPMIVGATVLLPKDYDQHPTASYPVIYEQGHFSLRPPLSIKMEPREPGSTDGQVGYQTFQAWSRASFPRMIAVTFQHPTPYFDNSYAVNSANNGALSSRVLWWYLHWISGSDRFPPLPIGEHL